VHVHRQRPRAGAALLAESRAAAQEPTEPRRLLAPIALLAATALGCTGASARPDAYHLDCVFDPRAPVTECPHLRERQTVREPALSAADELRIRGASASRAGTDLIVDVQLAGRFWNESDQNLYLFIGAAAPSGASSTYALTADPAYASDTGYPIRNAVRMPHTNDIRVGVMAPTPRSYTPQVYAGDAVHALAVGPDTGVVARANGGDVHVEVPLARTYAATGGNAPERIGVTVATARDYVGFVDQASVRDVPASGAASATAEELPPASYPTLDARSHRFERVALRPLDGGVSVELDMAAPIADWAQTNLHVFFIPVPSRAAARPLLDPSKTRGMPYAWSYYCGVYSPHRIFCKASHGDDFTFDTAYAERGSLDAPAGVTLRARGDGRYALDLAADRMGDLTGGRATFAVVVAAGRDGQGPTSWYGSDVTTPRSP